MGLLSRDYMAGTKSFLADLFDSPFTYRRETGNRKIKIENPAISVISIPPEGDKAKREQMLHLLSEIQKLKGRFTITEEAKKYFETWHIALMDLPVNGRLEAFANRLQIYTLKMAMILSAINGEGLSISKGTMKQAADMAWKVWESIYYIDKDELTFGKVQVSMKKIMDSLKRNGKSSKSSVLRDTHLSSKGFGEALTTLIDSDRVKTVRVSTNGYSDDCGHLIRRNLAGCSDP